MSIYVELLCDKRNGGSVARKRVVTLENLRAEVDSIPHTEIVRRIRVIEHAVLDEKKFGMRDKGQFNDYISRLYELEDGTEDGNNYAKKVIGLKTYWDGDEYVDYENLWESK